MKYRPEIDGLRTVAVLPVILFHGGLEIFSGGFVGVDVFFVISGYLITTIIISDLDRDRFSVLNFYNRRARRILPALALVVACSTPFAWHLMLPTDFKDFAQSISAVSLFASNFLFWLESGYFAAAAENKPLLHTWSLAVEEQYYIFFPLLLMLLWRRWHRGTTAVLGLIFVASLAASQVLSTRAPDANFYLLPSRAWELMAGSLCAIRIRQVGVRSNAPLAVLGLVLILGSIFLYDGETPFPSLYALAPVMGTALIILFGTPATPAGRILATPPFVGIGLISYSAYLWHQPLFAFARIGLGHPPLWLMMGLAVLALALAWLTWRFVEQPTRKAPGAAWKIVSAAAAGSVAVFVLGVGLGYSGLHQQAFMRNLDPNNQVLLSNINRMAGMDHGATRDDGPCRFYIQEYGPGTDRRVSDCAAQHGKALVVFGDSHSIDVYLGLIVNSDRPFLIGVPQKDCRPHIVGTECRTTAMPRFFEAHAGEIGLGLYVQAGFWLLTDAGDEPGARNYFIDRTEGDLSVNDAAIGRVMDRLEHWDRLFPVVWMGPRIEPHVSPDAMLGRDCRTAAQTLSLPDRQTAAFRDLDRAVRGATEGTGVGYLSQIDLMRFDVRTELYTCDRLYWSDGDHWSPAGEKLFGGRIAPAVEEVFREPR